MIIRQAAFTGKEELLKGGLHCHTTRSDGKVSPADTIRIHKANGYDFLALTDHRKYNFENFAPETGMLIIPGMEIDKNIISEPGSGIHCFHTVVIGPTKEDGNPFEQDETVESGMVKDQYEFQKDLDLYHEKKQLTIYCHPEWSYTPAREYEDLKGNIAMELWNSGCVLENDLDDDNGPQWDELLTKGVRIFGVATDDGHQAYQHCKGWVRVNAEKTVSSVLNALQEGAFYASAGPEIYDFYVEDGKAYLDCSPASKIAFFAPGAPCPVFVSDNSSLMHAEFECRSFIPYLRAVVHDADGKPAWTNPIFFK